MQGILLVDKPKGWTSFDVVNYVRRLVALAEGKKARNCKVGHTGTLDPLATGLLVLLVGKEYTRRAPELAKLDKSYDVVMKLGETSTTADAEGELTFVSDRQPSASELQTAVEKFVGEIMQTPPIYSAMKVGGVRAYKLARDGKDVAMEARPALIKSIVITSYDYPFITFTAEVGSGTYVRSLVEDIGRELATGAYMSDLRRTTVGKFSLQNSVTDVKQLTAESLTAHIQQM